MASNLPPGVSEDMIPGNRPEDLAWEELFNQIGEECRSVEEAAAIWRLGKAARTSVKGGTPKKIFRHPVSKISYKPMYNAAEHAVQGCEPCRKMLENQREERA